MDQINPFEGLGPLLRWPLLAAAAVAWLLLVAGFERAGLAVLLAAPWGIAGAGLVRAVARRRWRWAGWITTLLVMAGAALWPVLR